MKRIKRVAIASSLFLSIGLFSQMAHAESSTTESDVGITFEGTMPIVEEDPPGLPLPNEEEPVPEPQEPPVEEPIKEEPIKEPTGQVQEPQVNPGKPNITGSSPSYPNKLPQTGKVTGSGIGIGSMLLSMGAVSWMMRVKLKKESVHEMQKKATV